MTAMAFQITSLTIVYSTQPVNSPQQEPVTRKMFSFDDVIMISADKKMIGAFVIDYIQHESWVEINFHFVGTWHCMFNWSRKLITLCSTLCQLIAYLINYTQIQIYWMESQIQTTSFREYALELYGTIRLYVTTESLNVTKLLDTRYIWNRRKRNSNTNIFVLIQGDIPEIMRKFQCIGQDICSIWR